MSVRARNWKRGAAIAAFAAAAMFNASVVHLQAQQVAVSQIGGIVTDPSGQAIAAAEVRMIETAKQEVHSAND